MTGARASGSLGVSPILIAGPTASGKSAYAMARAAEAPSVIVNADSMQVYADLRLLTARPGQDDEARLPHALFGFVDGADAYSTGRYLEDVARVLGDAARTGRRAIIVGGTGLYFKALLEGLSPVPPIPADVRAFWRSEAQRLGAAALHGVLTQRDPDMGAQLRPSDPQRVTRALEVLDATGRSLAEWQRIPGTPLILEAQCETVVILPDRAALFARADARFDAMIDRGALNEVAALAERRLDPALPVMRALGVPQLMQHVAGQLPLSEAVTEAKLETRRYIKRQMTWIKKNMMSWKCTSTQ
jgi:tRNA dimethylallyltransferase